MKVMKGIIDKCGVRRNVMLCVVIFYFVAAGGIIVSGKHLLVLRTLTLMDLKLCHVEWTIA